MGRALGVHQGRVTLVAVLWRCKWGRGWEGAMGLAPLCQMSVTPSATHNQIGSFWCWFLGGWACVHSRPLWVSQTNSPVRLGVCPAAASTPTGVFNQWFEALFPCAWALGCAVCHSVHQPLPCWPAAALHIPLHNPTPCWVHQPPAASHQPPATSCFLARSPLCPGCPSPPLLPVWMNVSSLSPWLSDFYTVWFSVSSCWFLFLNCCCPTFGFVRRHGMSTYASILAGSPKRLIFKEIFLLLRYYVKNFSFIKLSNTRIWSGNYYYLYLKWRNLFLRNYIICPSPTAKR